MLTPRGGRLPTAQLITKRTEPLLRSGDVLEFAPIKMQGFVKQKTRRAIKHLIDNRLVYFRLAKDSPGVLLTFDDGPHPEYTPKILSLLAEYDARAVFFLVGEEAEKEPELVKEIHRRGHYIGNHTHTHLNDHRDGAYTVSQYLAEIERCRAQIQSIAGVETRLFRPPRGELNLKTLTATLRSRHRLVHWSLEGGEWGQREQESGQVITEFVLNSVRPRDIVLLHDDNEKTIQVLESLLPLCAERQLDLSHNSLVG